MPTIIPNGQVGKPYSYSYRRNTLGNDYFYASGAPGLNFSYTIDYNGYWTFSGTPTRRGTYSLQVCNDRGYAYPDGAFTLSIGTGGHLFRKDAGHLVKKGATGHLVTGIAPVGSPSITTDAIPNVLRGSPYSVQLAATGGATPYTWSKVAGSFPSGISLSLSGLIAGTSTGATGSYSVTVRCSDAAGYSATRTYVFALNPSVSGSIEIHLLTYCNFNLGGGHYIALEDLDLHVKDPNGYLYGRGRTYPAGSASPNGGLLSPYINSCNESLVIRTDDEYVAWASNAPSGVYDFWGLNYDSYSSGGDVAIKMQIKLNGSVWWETQGAYLPQNVNSTSIYRLNTATGTVVIV